MDEHDETPAIVQEFVVDEGGVAVAPKPGERPVLFTEAEPEDEGSGHWSVKLSPNPEKIVQGKTAEEAVKAYMKAMGINGSVHRFEVQEVEAPEDK